MGDVPLSHPRYNSLMGRKLLTDAASDGLLADSALIAHGRGEAYDYLLGEKTCNSARQAISQAAIMMQNAESCVISVNGNTVALAADELIRCAAILQCPIEVNIYYRTDERMDALNSRLEKVKGEVSHCEAPSNWAGDWQKAVESVVILGAKPSGKIPNLEGPRANCCTDGILGADVIFVPLEDGDRCEALIAMGKKVIVVDLNPLSRTARMATITIVDELRRMAPLLLLDLINIDDLSPVKWNNEKNLDNSLAVMLSKLEN
ncbi:MAG: phosphopantothenate/pantothenate synthetase [Euryarchaeota archaeon]|jgi:4-phosphopantoate--beta-alanine ligase|nr:phosphopantothenate/pantothenate synthetase [Euryarchaeota archaeon]